MLGITVDITERKHAEQMLRESEERFCLVANTAPVLIWMCSPEGQITYSNDRLFEFTGKSPDGCKYGNTWEDFVHPDDFARVTQALSGALKNREPFSKEYRLRRRDGVSRWMFDIASPRFNRDGSLAGFIGSAIDATDQKLARETLEQVSGRLIEAQEKERSRIARELHDDICQRLALLSIELEQANRGQYYRTDLLCSPVPSEDRQGSASSPECRVASQESQL